jgi:hypothetical protein
MSVNSNKIASGGIGDAVVPAVQFSVHGGGSGGIGICPALVVTDKRHTNTNAEKKGFIFVTS